MKNLSRYITNTITYSNRKTTGETVATLTTKISSLSPAITTEPLATAMESISIESIINMTPIHATTAATVID